MTDRQDTALVEERDYLLGRIAVLGDDFAEGRLTESEYKDLEADLVARAAEVIRKIENGEPPSSTLAASSEPRRNNKVVAIAAVLAFVLLAGGTLAFAVDKRSGGDASSGDIVENSNTLLRKAQQAAGSGDGVGAIKTYDQVLKLDPTNAEALAYKGWLIRLAGLPDQGLASLDKAVAAAPNYPDAHFFRGYILLQDKSDPAGAVAEFEKFMASNPPQEMVPLVQKALDDAKAQVAAKAAK